MPKHLGDDSILIVVMRQTLVSQCLFEQNCSWSGTQKELADLYLRKLEIRFETKIEFDNYYLSYSGGKDSHLLYWFIKEHLKTNDIPIISVNTRLEHKEIMQRMYHNADKVLIPDIKPTEIKEKYGIPCFTKNQDEYIKDTKR